MSLYAKTQDIRSWSVGLGLLLTFLMGGCSQNRTKTIELLRVAVLPDQNETQLRDKYQPLLDHVKSHTGLRYELQIPETYEQLLQWFDDELIDMALFGGVTYVKAHLQSQAVPLVMRDVDSRFKSVAIVRLNNPANRLQDLNGASLAFGSRLSTSGHFMPRYFFQEQNIDPETFFSEIQYSGSHHLTAEWVQDGKVEVGVVNSQIVREMFLDGRLSEDKVKVIWESPPYADYVWALQPNISKQQTTVIRDVFLQMNLNAETKPLLQKLGGNYYIPAEHHDFQRLEQVLLQLE